MEKLRRAPALERFVKDIRPEDIRVRVVGIVSDKGDDSFMLEDETGKILVKSASGLSFENGSKVRIFGRPATAEQGIILEFEIAQDMKLLNQTLYKKTATLNQNKDTDGNQNNP